VACSPVDWTGLGIAPANLAWQEGHWSPLESTWITWGEGKDLRHHGACSHSCLSSGGEVLSDTRDHVCADKVVVLTGECTNTMQTCNLLSE
jgi:hypothetical protein